MPALRCVCVCGGVQGQPRASLEQKKRYGSGKAAASIGSSLYGMHARDWYIDEAKKSESVRKSRSTETAYLLAMHDTYRPTCHPGCCS